MTQAQGGGTFFPIGRDRVLFIAINVLGGLAVLASYAHGLLTHPDTRGAIWGGVPPTLRPLYTVSMLLAAVGYFPFTSFFLLRLDPATVRVGGRLGFGVLNGLYVTVLVASALWMPLTFAMLEQPGVALWWAIRLVLAAAGLGSVGLLAFLLAIRPQPGGVWYGCAVAGLVCFCFQTALLDAVVWPAYFPHDLR